MLVADDTFIDVLDDKGGVDETEAFTDLDAFTDADDDIPLVDGDILVDPAVAFVKAEEVAKEADPLAVEGVMLDYSCGSCTG